MASDTRIDALPGWVRRVVLESNGGFCTYCSFGDAEAIDHVIPLSRGGRDDVSNLVPVCKSCNSSKGNRTILEWKDSLICNGQFWPEYVTTLTDEGTNLAVAKVQRDVVERARAHVVGAAESLLGSFNRRFTQLGNLDEDSRRLLVNEMMRRCLQSEQEFAAEPHDRAAMRSHTELQRRSILRKLKRADARGAAYASTA